MTVNWRALPERLRRFDPAAVDFNNPGTWPLPVRIGMLAAACVVVLAGGYQWFLADSIERLEMLQRQEEELRRDYEHKAAAAAELPAYRLQQAHIESAVTVLLEQLPRETEIPGLLEDITGAALDSGLTVRAIDVKEEYKAGFYAELPVEMSVEGGYHELGAFVSRVAGLPRIVTLHDFDVEPPAPDRGIRMHVLAKTYRYLGGKEEAQ